MRLEVDIWYSCIHKALLRVTTTCSRCTILPFLSFPTPSLFWLCIYVYMCICICIQILALPPLSTPQPPALPLPHFYPHCLPSLVPTIWRLQQHPVELKIGDASLKPFAKEPEPDVHYFRNHTSPMYDLCNKSISLHPPFSLRLLLSLSLSPLEIFAYFQIAMLLSFCSSFSGRKAVSVTWDPKNTSRTYPHIKFGGPLVTFADSSCRRKGDKCTPRVRLCKRNSREWTMQPWKFPPYLSLYFLRVCVWFCMRVWMWELYWFDLCDLSAYILK